MFKKLLFSALVSSSLHAVPLEISEENARLAQRVFSIPRTDQTQWLHWTHMGRLSSRGESASLDMDPMGRIFVAEANRFWFGVPDLRRAREMIREDFQARTIEDRLAMYDRHADKRDRAWYTQTPDRLIRLEDRDGNGVADHRTLFPILSKRPSTELVSLF